MLAVPRGCLPEITELLKEHGTGGWVPPIGDSIAHIHGMEFAVLWPDPFKLHVESDQTLRRRYRIPSLPMDRRAVSIDVQDGSQCLHSGTPKPGSLIAFLTA